MQPRRYKQPAHEQPGFLAQEGQRQRRVNTQALGTLVAQRWSHFSAGRACIAAADKLRCTVLLRWGLAGFVAGVATAHALQRAAVVQCRKWQYMQLGRAFSAWLARVWRRRELAEVVEQAVALRARFLVLRGWRTWLQFAAARKAKRHTWTRAACFDDFCTMGKALDGWRGWLRRREARQRAARWAAAHLARSTRRRALLAWRRWAAQQRHWRHQLDLAQGFDRLRSLSWVLLAWAKVARELQGRRQEAVAAIRSALFGADARLLALGFRGWRQRAEREARLQDALYVAKRLHRFNTLHCCWQGWVQRLGYRRHLQQLSTRLTDLQPRLLLHFSIQSWEAAVAEVQAEAGQAYHRALQLPRVFVTWREAASRRAKLGQLGQQCRSAHERHTQLWCLRAWREWALTRAARQEQLAQATEWWTQRRRWTCLAAWRGWMANKVGRRQQEEQAAQHHARRWQRLVLQRWRQLARLRGLSACWYEYRLQREVFVGWRAHTHYKADKATKWRRAVRHRYLHLLRLGLGAWVAYYARQLQQLMRRALSAWHGPFLQAARHRRAQMAAAEAHRWRTLLAAALNVWRGPFLAAAKARSQSYQQAVALWRARRRHAALAAWQRFVVAARAKHARLAEFQGRLLPSRQRLVLQAWQLLRWERAARRGKAELAALHRAEVLLKAALCSWSRYYAARASKQQRWLSALMFCSRQRQRRAVLVWRDAAHAAAAVRRVEAVEGAPLGDARQAQQAQQSTSLPRGAEGVGLTALLIKLDTLRALASQQAKQGQGLQCLAVGREGTADGGAATASCLHAQQTAGGSWQPPWGAAQKQQGWHANVYLTAAAKLSSTGPGSRSVAGPTQQGDRPLGTAAKGSAGDGTASELESGAACTFSSAAEGQEGSCLLASGPWSLPRRQRPQPRRRQALPSAHLLESGSLMA